MSAIGYVEQHVDQACSVISFLYLTFISNLLDTSMEKENTIYEMFVQDKRLSRVIKVPDVYSYMDERRLQDLFKSKVFFPKY